MSEPKLVRDRIPEIIDANRGVAQIRIAEAAEIPGLLRAKLLEEAEEVTAATDKRTLVEELADLLEVIHAYAACSGVGMPEIDEARQAKQATRGGFGKGVVLISSTSS